MTTRLHTIGHRDSLEEAYETMLAHRIRHLPVIDESGYIVGILSDRDLLRASVPVYDESGPVRNELVFLAHSTVGNEMSTALKSVTVESDLQEAIDLMLREKISSCLVTKGDEVVGIITYEDLIDMLNRYLTKPVGSFRSNLAAWVAASPLGAVSNLLANNGI